jgi:hypothetical protein
MIYAEMKMRAFHTFAPVLVASTVLGMRNSLNNVKHVYKVM